MKILNVVGARPNFMKIAPLHRAMQARGIDSRIVHTGQHYDAQMSDVFFEQLELPRPYTYLGVGSGTHAEQTARVMTAFEPVVEEEAPDLVLVVGDVNSTVACSLVASKLHVPVAHVEAGLRSGDRRMPEEINRLVTDRLADFLFVTEPSGQRHLCAEGVPEEQIFFTGNVMIDTLVHLREKASEQTLRGDLDLAPGGYVLMTMHRPANVDNEEGLRRLLSIVEGIAAEAPLVFPMHPRTRKSLAAHGLMERLEAVENFVLLDPLGYLEFLHLMDGAGVVVTDSGGIQEETTFLQVPCLTLRENTERPVTVEQGTNELMPLEAGPVVQRVHDLLNGAQPGKARVPERWDGRAAERITDALLEHLPTTAPA